MGAKEVAAGAEWLDKNFPGWEREIDLGTLDIGCCHSCICGQSLRKFADERGFFSGYAMALNMTGLSYITDKARWGQTHGFSSRSDEPLWRELIKERFSTGNLSDLEES